MTTHTPQDSFEAILYKTVQISVSRHRELLAAHQAEVDRAVAETAKAYGGCKKCYGKGYSTWRHGESYVLGGTYRTHPIRTEMKFCACERGKQLENALTPKEEA